jgi:hypothetical protein
MRGEKCSRVTSALKISCHPERSVCFAKRSRHRVEGPPARFPESILAIVTYGCRKYAGVLRLRRSSLRELLTPFRMTRNFLREGEATAPSQNCSDQNAYALLGIGGICFIASAISAGDMSRTWVAIDH